MRKIQEMEGGVVEYTNVLALRCRVMTVGSPTDCRKPGINVAVE